MPAVRQNRLMDSRPASQLKVEDQAPVPILMGRHLLELGVQPGPDMGRLLDECYEAQLDGEFATVEDGLIYARNKFSTLC
jgi:tRNA nucleotidyltransferase (CCA-adding enzyme)